MSGAVRFVFGPGVPKRGVRHWIVEFMPGYALHHVGRWSRCRARAEEYGRIIGATTARVR